MSDAQPPESFVVGKSDTAPVSYVAPSDGWYGGAHVARTEFSTYGAGQQGGDEVASGLHGPQSLDQNNGQGGPGDGPPDGPVCFCGLPATRLISRSDRNPNRPFLKCPKFKDDPGQCKFFAWEDELGQQGNPSPSRPPAQRRRVEGPASYAPAPAHAFSEPNPPPMAARPYGGGGTAYTYTAGGGAYAGGYGGGPAQPPAGGGSQKPPAPYGAGGGEGDPEPGAPRTGDVCFRCGESGHWSKDCPTLARSGGGHGGGTQWGGPATSPGLAGGGAGGRGACFKCGATDHWARDCPNPTGGGGGGGTQYNNTAGGYGGGAVGGGGGGRGNCFKCGQDGHWARDCPGGGGAGGGAGGRGGGMAGGKRRYDGGGGGGGGCYKCGAMDHWSNKCPNA